MNVNRIAQTAAPQTAQAPQHPRRPDSRIETNVEAALCTDRAVLRPLRVGLAILSLGTAAPAGMLGGLVANRGLEAAKLISRDNAVGVMTALPAAAAGYIGARFSDTFKGSVGLGAAAGGAVAAAGTIAFGVMLRGGAGEIAKTALQAAAIGAASGAVSGAVEHAWYRQ